jgi:hypothetical protein
MAKTSEGSLPQPPSSRKRTQDQVNIAEALEAAARPHDDVTVSEYPMLKVLELAAAQHAAELRQVTGLAKIISERRPA